MTTESTSPHHDLIRRAGSTTKEAKVAVEELAFKLGTEDLNSMVFFCSSSYDLRALGQAIKHNFTCPVVGCTTAGEILSPAGYMQESIVAVGFATSEISLQPIFIP